MFQSQHHGFYYFLNLTIFPWQTILSSTCMFSISFHGAEIIWFIQRKVIKWYSKEFLIFFFWGFIFKKITFCLGLKWDSYTLLFQRPQISSFWSGLKTQTQHVLESSRAQTRITKPIYNSFIKDRYIDRYTDRLSCWSSFGT